MRILQLIDTLDAGGAERVAVNFANTLVSEIDGSYLCATRREGLLKESIKEGVGYICLNKKSTLDFKAISLLSRYVKTHSITIIHAHASSYFLGTLIKILNPKLKLIWHDHYGKSDFLDQRPKRVLRFCSTFFNHIFSVNSKLKTWSENHLKTRTVSCLPNFAIKTETSQQTQLKGIDGKRIICLANLRAQKDHITLLNAFKKVVVQQPDWSLHLVGQDFKDDYSHAIFQFIKDKNLDKHIFIYGSCPDTFAILAQSSIGVLSSKSEGLPLALLEYGLAGLPTVVTDVGDCSKVVSHKKTGFLVPSQTPLPLSKALLYCIENKTEVSALGRALKNYVETDFSENASMLNVVTIYNNITATN